MNAYCPVCRRLLSQDTINPDTGDCLHGLGLPPEPWTGGLDLTPEQLAEMYPEEYGPNAATETT